MGHNSTYMHTPAVLAQMQPLLPMLDDLPAQWQTWKEQFGSYLKASGLDRAPKEKQLAIFLQRLGTDRPRILPTRTGNKFKPDPHPWKKDVYTLKFTNLRTAQENKSTKTDSWWWCARSCSLRHQNPDSSWTDTRSHCCSRGNFNEKWSQGMATQEYPLPFVWAWWCLH